MRRSDRFLAALAVGGLLVLLSLFDAAIRAGGSAAGLSARADLVRELGLSDLALFTEARYTRHPSLADLHSPFQDYPMALEHFPSGSLVPPKLPPRP